MKRFAFMIVVLLWTAVAFAQGEELPVGPAAWAEFIALSLGSGVTVAVVQLLRKLGVVSLIPAFLRPIIAMGIGLAAVKLSAFLGVTVDLSALQAIFAGGGATALFGIGKELQLPGFSSKG